MADAYGRMELSEQRNVRVTLTPVAPTTAITISTATVTLYDSGGAVAGSVSGLTATFDTGSQAAPRVWWLMRPSVLGITAGLYVATFKITDSTGFVWEPTVSVRVVADGS